MRIVESMRSCEGRKEMKLRRACCMEGGWVSDAVEEGG